jgi:hypothetical protein
VHCHVSCATSFLEGKSACYAMDRVKDAEIVVPFVVGTVAFYLGKKVGGGLRSPNLCADCFSGLSLTPVSTPHRQLSTNRTAGRYTCAGLTWRTCRMLSSRQVSFDSPTPHTSSSFALSKRADEFLLLTDQQQQTVATPVLRPEAWLCR